MTDRDGADRVVYLDYAATTPVAPSAAEAMNRCLTVDGDFANPASAEHRPGRRARDLVEAARGQVAALVGALPEQIVWTSGATESDNLAVLGVARRRRDQGRHILTSRTEHKAVLDACRRLEAEGFSVTRLVPDRSGRIDPDQVRAGLRPDTILVSIMHVNNEIGVIQDIAAIGSVCADAGVPLHVDAAQSGARLPIDLAALPVSLMSFSAHKMYGPKGVGALFVSGDPLAAIDPLMFGGGHEGGVRPGTPATHQAVGMGEACRLVAGSLAADDARARRLRDRLWDGLAPLGGLHWNGSREHAVPGIVNIAFEGVEGESLILGLDDLAVARGAACSSASPEASYVLRALGRSDHLAASSLRFSTGRWTTDEDIDAAVRSVRREVERLRHIAAGAGGDDDAYCDAGNAPARTDGVQ